MNRRSKLALWGLLGSLSAASMLRAPDVCAQADVRMIRPDVMVLLDSSGSMEWRNGVSNAVCNGGDGGTCNQCSNGVSMCSSSCPAAEQRNRWTTALEVLTGTIQNFSCIEAQRTNGAIYGYDYLYPVPHHAPLSNNFPLYDPRATQAVDGIMDSYSDRVRFGLMTFDNDYCVGLTDTFGMFSYGPNRQFQPNGCTTPPVDVNIGSRRNTNGASDPVPGGLISVGPATADPGTLAVINQAVQGALVGIASMGATPAVPGVRPYGGTPIAAMLDDARYYWTTNPDVTDGSNGSGVGDPYFNCRQRFNILITDGKPNMDFRPSCEGSAIGCPYVLPEQSALAMSMPGGGQPQVKTFVIGFNASDTGVQAALTPIAINGGTTAVQYASDRTSLRAALSTVLDSISATTTTRTAPAFGGSNNGGTSTALYQFQSSFAVASGVPWEGVLERRRTVCDNTMSPPAPVDQPVDPVNDEFGVLLQSTQRLAHGWGQRRLWTSLASGANPMRGTLSVATGSSARTTLETVPTAMYSLQTSAPVGTPACQTDVNALLSWVRGDASDTYRGPRPLGAIYHSNPAIVGAPSASLPDQSYANFRRTTLPTSAWRTSTRPITNREQIAYVGSTDGILHAFNTDTGEEAWGFVPPYLVSDLVGMCPNNFRYGVDGTPVVRDVLMQRTSSNLDPGTGGTGWRTVLVVGLRGGGGAYEALDVTDPYNPQFLWQFTDTDLGQAYGTPVITNISTNWSTGLTQERAVAILPGGAGVPLTSCTDTSNPRGANDSTITWTQGQPRAFTRCWQGTTGQYLYVVDLATGQIIAKMRAQGSPIVGSPSVYLGQNGSVATRAYVGDSDGVLWRLDMTNPNPSAWRMSMIYDLFATPNAGAQNGQPLQGAPLLSVDRDGSLLIAIGSGDQDLLEGHDANRIAVVRETVQTSASGVNTGWTMGHRWLAQSATATSVLPANGNDMVLQPGERLTGPVSLFNGTMYFGTFVPNSGPDACQMGFSRLWGIDQVGTAGDGLPTARLDVDGDPTTTSDIYRWTRDLNGNGSILDDQNSVLYGVGVIRRPSCVTRTTAADPYTGMNRDWVSAGPNQGGDFRLVAQTGRGGVATPGVRTNTFSRALATPAVESVVNAWALVVE